MNVDGVFDHKSFTEKSFAKMVKAKAKADRAAIRQATAGASSAVTPPIHVLTPPPQSDPTSQDPATATSTDADVEDPPLPVISKEPAVDRTDLLRSKPVVVGRFLQLMVPILVDVYAASVITPVRVKTLTGLLKAVSFLDGNDLKRVLTVCRIVLPSPLFSKLTKSSSMCLLQASLLPSCLPKTILRL